MLMTRNSRRTVSLIFGAVGLGTLIALAIPAAAQTPTPQQIQQENNHLYQERLRAAEMERNAANSRPGFSPGFTIPKPGPVIGSLEYDLETLKYTSESGGKGISLPSTLGESYIKAITQDPYRKCFTKIETLVADTTEDSRAILRQIFALDTPALRQLYLRGTADEWVQLEAELTGLAQTDSTAYARFARLTEVHLRLSCRTQRELDHAVRVLSRSKRLTGVCLTCGLPVQRFPTDGPTDTLASDLFGLAKLEQVRTIELNVFSLARTSLDLPDNLESLIVREAGLSKDPLLHIQLPARLRKLAIFSGNATTNDRFTALVRASDMKCDLHLPYFITYSSDLRDGSWVKAGEEGRPPQEIVLGSDGVLRRSDGAPLIPGHRDVPRLQEGDSFLGLRLELFDSETRPSMKFPGEKESVFKGWASLTLTFTGDGGLTIALKPSVTPSGLDPEVFRNTINHEPDDGAFRKAVEKALVGTWKRPAIGSPPRMPVRREVSSKRIENQEGQVGSSSPTGNQNAAVSLGGLLFSWATGSLFALLFLAGGVILWKRSVGSRHR